MKCLACNNEGVYNWLLTSFDFKEYGISNNRFELDKCFCSTCYNNRDLKLDPILYNYWLLIQPIETKEETKPNYYTWHSKVSCKEVSQEFMSNLGQAIQYIWRSNTLKTTKGQTKEEIIKDLEKAQDFIGFEIQRLKEGK